MPRLSHGLRRAARARRWLPWRYLVPVGGIAGVLLLTLSVAPLLDLAAPLLFLGVVLLSGLLGGPGPAVLGAACGFLVLDYFFEDPPDSLALANPRTASDLFAFLLVAVLLGSLNGRLREALRRAEHERAVAETAVQARDGALAVVSHDLRTPVTAIQASVAALRESELELPEALRQRLLANIAAEADRLGRFIGDALALGRLEAGLTPSLVVSDAGEIVSAVLDRCLPLLADRPVAVEVPDDLPPVRCGPALLEQALENLLVNVAVHTPRGGRLAVRGRVDGGCLRLEVSDAGPGIPPEARERVFQKYERLNPDGHGAGLGLALARAAMEAQGGRLWVEDSEWGGAQFVLLLPLEQPRAAAVAV